jgi:hypothetical protein
VAAGAPPPGFLGGCPPAPSPCFPARPGRPAHDGMTGMFRVVPERTASAQG